MMQNVAMFVDEVEDGSEGSGTTTQPRDPVCCSCYETQKIGVSGCMLMGNIVLWNVRKIWKGLQ